MPNVPWTLVCAGDIMLNGVPVKQDPFKAVAPIFTKADVRFANLEIPLTNVKTITPRKTAKEIKERNQFVLKADPGHIGHIKTLNLDFVSLGNNHAMDGGNPGLKQNMGLLDQAGIGHSGAGLNVTDAQKMSITTTKSGVKVGMISYLGFVGAQAIGKCGPASATSPGIAALSFNGVIDDNAREGLRKRMEAAHKKAHVVLVAMHWGIERQTVPTAYQVQLAHALIDAGADGVLGSHPHVLQGSETYKGKPIEYSMGNFVSALPASSAIYRLKFKGASFVGRERIGIAISKGMVGRVKMSFDALDTSLNKFLARFKAPSSAASKSKPPAPKKPFRSSPGVGKRHPR